jgi:hypothetical protein
MTQYRRIGLGAPVGDYAMLWSPAGQMMGDGAEAFWHDGAINTLPSHDLAHLLVAASSTLPWRPSGPIAGVFFAEYNAVMTEHLLDRLYRAHIDKSAPVDEVVPGLLAHGKWFVEEHFKPFPTTAADALTRWSSGVDTGRLTALSPYFFDMKKGERDAKDFDKRTWTARFAATDAPAGWSNLRPLIGQSLQTIQTIAR